MAPVSPSEPVENEANTDSRRLDREPHSGHGASPSIALTGRSSSNVVSHDVQPYS